MKKIFSLFAAMMLMVSTVSATTIYCKMTHSWWTINESQQPAAVAIHHWGGTTAGTTWPGVRMTPVEGQEGTWSYDVPADVDGLIFVRVNGSGDIADWGAKTANLSLPTDDKNLYTITSESPVWGDPGCTGEWSVYVPAEGGEGGDVDPQPGEKPYVALIGEMNGWDGSAPNQLVPAEDGLTASLTVNLAMNEAHGYQFKILVGSIGLSAHHGEGEPYYRLHSEWNEVKLDWVYENSEPLFVDMNAAGDYTFTFTYADSTLVVTFPENGGGVDPQPGEKPYVALIGEMNGWAGDVNPLVAAEDGLTASVTVNLADNANHGYAFKILVGSVGLSAHHGEGETSYAVKSDWNEFKLDWDAENADVLWLVLDGEGDYTFTFTYADSTLHVTFPEKPEPVLADGYYLIGKINGVEVPDWNFENINKDYLLVRNTEATENEEYQIAVTLAENDEFKVVKVENDAIKFWYPDGENNNYLVDADHAGQATISFRPNADGGEDWHYNVIYVAVNGGAGIDNTAVDAKAVKMIKNGMLLIIKGDKTYNVMGQIVK